jgi:hypothetical protein
LTQDERIMKAVITTLNGMLRSGWQIRPGGKDDALNMVALVDGETIGCVLEPEDDYLAGHMETSDMILGGFLIAGRVMTPEVAAGHIAKRRSEGS